MNRTDAFRVLGIAPVKDRKIIKKAYASLVKQYHPDDYPEKWKELHDAYEIALIYAKEAKREERKEFRKEHPYEVFSKDGDFLELEKVHGKGLKN